MSSKKGLIHDFSRGWQIAMHSVRMFTYSIASGIVITGLLVAAFAAIHAWLGANDLERPLYWAWIRAQIIHAITPFGHVSVTLDGVERLLGAGQYIEDESVKAVVGRINEIVLHDLGIGSLFALPIIAGLMISALHQGAKLRQDQHIRGGQVVPAELLAEGLEGRGLASDIRIGTVPILAESEVQHIMVSGAPGTGKSVLIMAILDQIRQRKQRAIVYDISGDFVQKYYRPGLDIILNPMDARSPSWNPWAEVRIEYDYERLAESLIPEGDGERFWTDVARSLVAGAMLKFGRLGKSDLAEFLSVLLVKDMEKLAELVSGTEAASLISADESAAKLSTSIRNSAAPYLRCLKLLSREERAFSVREWINEEHEGWLFVSSRLDYHAALRPLLSCWLDCAAASLMSLVPDRNRRLWFVLDELPSLQKMPSIPRLLAMGRKYGGAGILGIQSISQLQEVYKREGASTLTGLCSTHAIFRAPDPDTADWASRMAGEAEIDEANENLSYADNDSRDSVSLNGGKKVKKIILASEISGLPNLNCYVKLAGNFPVARVALTPRDRPSTAEPYVEAAAENSIGFTLGVADGTPKTAIPLATEQTGPERAISSTADIYEDHLL